MLPQDRPLAGVKVGYGLGDCAGDRRHDRRPRRGPFRHPHGRTGVLRLAWHFEAAIPSRSLSLRRNVTVATRGFSIGLETNRPLYRGGRAVRRPT